MAIDLRAYLLMSLFQVKDAVKQIVLLVRITIMK